MTEALTIPGDTLAALSGPGMVEFRLPWSDATRMPRFTELADQWAELKAAAKLHAFNRFTIEDDPRTGDKVIRFYRDE